MHGSSHDGMVLSGVWSLMLPALIREAMGCGVG